MDISLDLMSSLTFGLLGFVMGLFLGFGAEETGRSTSPTGMKVSILGFMLGGFLFPCLMGWIGGDEKAGFIGGIICASTCSLTAACLAAGLAEHLNDLVCMAPCVRDYVLERFQAFDADGDGVITKADLEVVPPGRSLDEYALRRYIAKNLEEIGHVVDSGVSSTFVYVGSSTMMPVTHTHCRWGISREDLPTYPERVRAKYRSWL